VHRPNGRILKYSFTNVKARFSCLQRMYCKISRAASEETILELLHAKCIPAQLNATEVFPMLSRDKQTLESTLTSLFIKKSFAPRSPTAVVECQRNFCFIPVVLQIRIRMARFSQVFAATENRLCLLFCDNAAKQ